MKIRLKLDCWALTESAHVCSKAVVHVCQYILCLEFMPKPSSKSFFSCLWRNILSARLLKYVHKLFRNPINSGFEMKLGWFGMGWAKTAGLRITVYVCVWEIEGILWSPLMNLLWAVCEHDEGVLMVFPWSWCSPQRAEEEKRYSICAFVVYNYVLLQAECSLRW